MAGLNCGTPSPVAWPLIKQGFDAFLTIPDTTCVEAMRRYYTLREEIKGSFRANRARPGWARCWTSCRNTISTRYVLLSVLIPAVLSCFSIPKGTPIRKASPNGCYRPGPHET